MPHWEDADPSKLRKLNDGVDGAPADPAGGDVSLSGGQTYRTPKICCRSSGTGLSSFDGKQDCGSPFSDPEIIWGGWWEGQWLSVNGSERQCPISTATEFVRCAKMGQIHQSMCPGITFNNNDTSVELVDKCHDVSYNFQDLGTFLLSVTQSITVSK
jgi:hypothetical protein